jgi:uncharacterized protein YecE (DUF72 family)
VSIRIGTSGWSYPSWRPGFYPAGMAPASFLGFYAARFDTVELNTTGYRLPPPDQFRRWAEAVPDGFVFAPKLAPRRLASLPGLVDRVRPLGDRLGPLRILVAEPRDDALLAAVLARLDPDLELAFDFRHDSWDGVDGVVAVDDPSASPFRYLRLREPPYSDEQLRELARGLRGPAYVYLRHEEAPTAPLYAARLLELLSAEPRPA